MTCAPNQADRIRLAILAAGIACVEIGRVLPGPPMVWDIRSSAERTPLPYPERDEIARVYEQIA
jgi:hypothetical protein